MWRLYCHATVRLEIVIFNSHNLILVNVRNFFKLNRRMVLVVSRTLLPYINTHLYWFKQVQSDCYVSGNYTLEGVGPLERLLNFMTQGTFEDWRFPLLTSVSMTVEFIFTFLMRRWYSPSYTTVLFHYLIILSFLCHPWLHSYCRFTPIFKYANPCIDPVRWLEDTGVQPATEMSQVWEPTGATIHM